jgi:DNA-binding transcriptional ArsR family regulator
MGDKCMSTKETGSNRPTTQSIDEPQTENNVDEDVDTEEQSPESTLSLDLIFEILKNQRRREVIRYLREHEQQVTLSDLAEHIAALENDTDVASITSSQRKRVYVGLYQCHLPKMADMDIVHFNQNRGIVDLGPNAPQLYEYLDNDDGSTRKWHKYYIGISAFGIGLFILTLVLGQPALLQTAALASLCAAIVACSTLQTVAERDDGDE